MTGPLTFLSDAELDLLKQTYPELRTSSCPTCRGATKYTWRGEEHPCDCPQQSRLHLRYLHAGIGLIFQRLSWADYHGDAQPAINDYLDHAEAYLDRGIGLFLCGPPGSGKTLLANLVLKELVKLGYDCYATLFSSTVEAFTATWNDDEARSRFAKRFMNSKVLLLDDFGKEFRRSNRLHATTFDHILRTRTQNARSTILTTNLTAREVSAGYGGGVLSLLVEKSIEVQVSGEDFRASAQERDLDEIRRGEVRPIF